METPIVVEYASIRPQPWKNGHGITRNLFDDVDDAGGWSWRVSIAEITGEQPYSSYPGVRRGQVALGPGEVELTIDGRPSTLAPESVVVFDGEAAVSALPASAGFLDLNVMVRRDAWKAEIEVARDPVLGPGDIIEGGFIVLLALEDGCSVDGRVLHRLDGVRLVPGAEPSLSGRFVVARLWRVETTA